MIRRISSLEIRAAERVLFSRVTIPTDQAGGLVLAMLTAAAEVKSARRAAGPAGRRRKIPVLTDPQAAFLRRLCLDRVCRVDRSLMARACEAKGLCRRVSLRWVITEIGRRAVIAWARKDVINQINRSLKRRKKNDDTGNSETYSASMAGGRDRNARSAQAKA